MYDKIFQAENLYLIHLIMCFVIVIVLVLVALSKIKQLILEVNSRTFGIRTLSLEDIFFK